MSPPTPKPCTRRCTPFLKKRLPIFCSFLPISASQGQKDKLFSYFKSIAPETADARKHLDAARKAKDDFEATIPRCLVSATNAKPRTVRVLPRGNFLVETDDIVQPALPAYLVSPAKNTDGRRLNRLDLANWLVSRENPLTARVVMNRLWKQFFGLGLSRVVDDLGAQGELPPDQPLLDWLACEFMDSGWDMKHMIRLIVNSDTYQQTSVVSQETSCARPAQSRDRRAESLAAGCRTGARQCAGGFRVARGEDRRPERQALSA